MFSLAGCGAADDPPARPAGAGSAVTVVAYQVQARTESLRVETVGTSRARATAVIYPETGGEVQEVLFAPGDHVEAGDALLTLESTEESLAVRLAEVEVANAEQLLARYRRIEDTGAVSDSQIDEAQTAVNAARIALDQARVALAERTVRAPFAGHLGLTDVDPGARITSTTPIGQLDDRRVLFVDFDAPEELFGQLGVGDVVTMAPFAAGGGTLEADVIAIDSHIDPALRTLTVRARIDNADDRFRPGMSFRVAARVFGRSYPAVPEAAVLWGSDGPYVFALDEQVVRRTPVEIVSRESGFVLVRGDLPEGSMIVLEGIQKVRDGTLVKIRGQDPLQSTQAESDLAAAAGDQA